MRNENFKVIKKIELPFKFKYNKSNLTSLDQFMMKSILWNYFFFIIKKGMRKKFQKSASK